MLEFRDAARAFIVLGLICLSPLLLLTAWPGWTAILIVPVVLGMLYSVNRLFWAGYDQIEGGDNPQVGVYMRFGKLARVIMPGEKFWLFTWVPKLFRVTKVSLRRQTLQYPFSQWSRDRIGITGRIQIIGGPAVSREHLTTFFRIVWNESANGLDARELEKTVEGIVKDAFWRAVSRFSQEEILGFEEISDKKSRERKRRQVRAITGAKDRLKESLDREIRVKTLDLLGWEIVGIDILDLDLDGKAREALEAEELATFSEKAHEVETRKLVARTEALLSAARGNPEFIGTALDVMSRDSERIAAEQGGQLALLAQRLAERKEAREAKK